MVAKVGMPSCWSLGWGSGHRGGGSGALAFLVVGRGSLRQPQPARGTHDNPSCPDDWPDRQGRDCPEGSPPRKGGVLGWRVLSVLLNQMLGFDTYTRVLRFSRVLNTLENLRTRVQRTQPGAGGR